MFNNEVGATWQVYGFTKSSFNLLGNTILVKNGQPIIIKSDYFCFFGCNALNVVTGIVINIAVIYNYLVKVFIQQITQDTGGFCLLTQYLGGGYCTFQISLNCLPGFNQFGKVFMEFSSILSFGSGTNYYPKVFGFNSLHYLLEPFSFLGRMDLPGNGYYIIKRSDYYKTSGKGNFATKAGAFSRDGFF